ncbi:MAG: hypothetical protein LBB82_07605 [Treponema sp.]|jgi:two-component system chemotaxis sensor kinase CheA|nr:hypothetical protein [Treponema sp.]
MASRGDVLLRFLSSNQFENPRDEAVVDDMVRYVIYNAALILGASFVIIFGITVIFGGNVVRGTLDLALGGMCVLFIFLLRTKVPFVVSAVIPLASFGALCVVLVASGGERGFAGLWIYSFPILVIFITGLSVGTILIGFVLAALMVVTLIPGLAGFSYTLSIAFRYICVYLLVVVLTIVYEQIRVMKDRWSKQLTVRLKVERDLINAMKDNLKTGLFLMDKDFIIQGSYSKPLEEILGTDEIEGKRFTDLLSASIKAKERDTLEDYFNMVINRSFDVSMLEEINPISEFSYLDEISQKLKTLRTSFAAVDQGSGIFFVLGTVEDVTAARELQKQLEEESAKREEEMRALFQVIQVEPRVFGDFIEDTEYEFNRINETLKNRSISARDAMVEIYQSVHAIKSNALILGLENFSAKLHELENSIRTYRDQIDISFEDVLHVTVELERIMKEKDKFRDTIAKIEAFKVSAGSNRRQDRHVLIETLTRACEKAATAQEKKVQFIVEELDGSILETGPRRVIKEVLTQLVRNAVYHGIETPEERKKQGKDPEGKVRLVIKNETGRIHLKLSDDGKGLNFQKIKEKALKQHLFKNPSDAENPNQLLQVIFAPGFSTAEIADVHAGRGIGLNLVKERLKDLRGSIKISFEPGKGTTFNLYIPIKEESVLAGPPVLDKAS